jgi:transcriptional regulator with XRE-family HTH domain
MESDRTIDLDLARRYRTARRAFSSDAEMARAFAVDRSRVARWKQGEAPDAANAERLVALDVTVTLLSGYLAESSIPKWLVGTNAHLGDRRPIEVLRQGRLSEVIAAIEAEKGGAFA